MGRMGRRPCWRGRGGRAFQGVSRDRARCDGGGGSVSDPRRQGRRGWRRRGGCGLLRAAALRGLGPEEGVLTVREPLRPVLYDESGDAVRLLDQRLLPGEETWLALPSADAVAEAIRGLAVRGAPAIGVAAAYALACEARRGASRAALEAAAERLVLARPTAVNLAWAVKRMSGRFGDGASAL